MTTLTSQILSLKPQSSVFTSIFRSQNRCRFYGCPVEFAPCLEDGFPQQLPFVGQLEHGTGFRKADCPSVPQRLARLAAVDAVQGMVNGHFPVLEQENAVWAVVDAQRVSQIWRIRRIVGEKTVEN